MKKYIKLLTLILLMIININVYAYNWCKGGVGENAYNFCDQQIYYYGDRGNSSSYAPQWLGNIDNGFYTFQDILDKTKNVGGYKIYQYSHDTDKRKDKNGTYFAISDYASCNGTCDSVFYTANFFTSNSLKDILDAASDSQEVTNFNNNVKKTTITYYTDYQHKIANRQYVRINRYTLSSSVELIYIETDLGNILNPFGAKNSAHGWRHNIPKASNRPDYIYYKGSDKSILTTTSSGATKLTREDLLVASSLNDSGGGYNWCKGGEGVNSYNLCKYASDEGYSDCPGDSNFNTELETIVSNMDYNQNQVPMGIQDLPLSGYLLSIFSCPNGQCEGYSESNCHNNYRYTNPYTNNYLLKNSDFAVAYNSNVISESKTYYDVTKSKWIKITMVTMPVLDVNGALTRNYNKALLIEISDHVQINNIGKEPGNSELLGFLDGRYISWPKNLYATTTNGWTIKSTQFNGSTRFYDGSTGTEEIERITIESDACGGVAKLKSLVEKYLIKALHIIAPIILFALTTVDFVHSIFSGQKELNKAVQNFAKRALVCILIYFAGNIITMLMDLAGIESCGTVDTDGDIVESIQYDGSYDCSDFND